MFVKDVSAARLKRAICEVLEDRRLLTALTGTVIGTPSSYHSSGNVSANAFDANFSTYFDAPDSNGDWVGLKLVAPAVVSQVQYAPRATLATRMVGGLFQGSSTADFSSGVVNLFTISAVPAYGSLTSQTITNPTAFQYVRYLGPNLSYCDIAELAFSGTASSTAATLPYTVSGTAGSFGNSGNTVAKADDQNLNTFFDAPTANGNFVSATFSSEAILSSIQYAPRSTYASRMIGGTFQGSNSSTFSSGVTNLYTITSAPAVGVLTTVPITTTAAYEYVRYAAPAGSYGDIAEMAFQGTLTGTQAASNSPAVTSSSPANGATGVSPTAFISCALYLPHVGAGVNPGSMTSSNVYLYRTFDHAIIATEVNTDAAGSVIVLQPQSPLAANTTYTFVATSGVTDNVGTPFTPYQISFTTGAQTAPTNPKIAFNKVALPTATGQLFSGVTMGPDGNLYACTLLGAIYQFPVNSDGSLGNPINLATSAGIPSRLIIGMAFDPSSTPTHMILWISSGNVAESNAPDFSGSIGAITISGSYASKYQDYVVGLPRSNSNHLNDQPVFGPDGALYWCQGSNSSMGAPDSVWGYRNEHLLNAAILRLNIQAIEQYVATNKGPLNAQTDSLPSGKTAYNPYASGAPLSIYATGVRNAFDLIWDTNGHLYAPTNGSAAGGNIPATPAGETPAAPGEVAVGQAEDDYLFNIQQGGYYGHPDPARGQYIFGGGNPTHPTAGTEIQTAYPLGTNADPNYKGFAYDFGVHYSPDGAIEYTGSAFGGALNGALLITEYSGGKDILALTTGSQGQITASQSGIAGFTGFEDPVDVIENPRTGDLYVADLGTLSLVLLQPLSTGATISTSQSTLYFNSPVNGAPSPAQSITITNTGSQPLAIPATGVSGVGADAYLFPIANQPQLPAVIAPGGSITLGVVFNPGSSSLGLHTAQLQISSDDSAHPLVTINLRAITTAGVSVSQQPSLQAILNLYQIPDNVGTQDPTQSFFTAPPLSPNDEVQLPELQKAGSGPVTITPLAAFDSNLSPAADFGYYPAGSPTQLTQLFTIAASDSQSVSPTPVGSTSFDPGSSVFGIYAAFDAILNPATGTPRVNYSEFPFNAYDSANHHKIRYYPLKNSSGSVVPNAYVFAVDDGGVLPQYEFNNLVGIIYNVQPAGGTPYIGTQNVAGSDNESAPSSMTFVFSSIAGATGSTSTHTSNDLRIDDGGSAPLVISSISSDNAFFSVSSALSFPLTIPVGASLDVSLLYSPVHTDGASAIDTGSLTISSNDPVSPNYTVSMTGIWQAALNTTTAPSLNQIVGALGYTTTITNAGQSIDQGGQVSAVGQEVLSRYWTRADNNLPLTVQQVASYSGLSTGASLYWYNQGHSTSLSSIVSISGNDTQSVLPLANDATGAAAIGMVSPVGNFGFNVDKSEFSDDSLNKQGTITDQGHHMRFWPVYNSTGARVPNAWLMAMDYTSASAVYAYNANVYLISNMVPAAPATPTGLAAVGSVSGINVSWNVVSDPLLRGYLLFRSTAANGPFASIGTGVITATSFLDATAVPGTKYYYTLCAADTQGSMSAYPSSVSATRTKNTIAPPVPASLSQSTSSIGVALKWSADTESDLAGYNVYRAGSISGTYYKLNSAPLTSASFTDSSSPAGQVSYYHVTAVNQSGTESAASSITATRPGTIAGPATLSAKSGSTGITLTWSASSASGLAGYDLLRSNASSGVFTQINSLPLSGLSYVDTAAPKGQVAYYRVVAVTTSAVQSAAATASAAN